MKLPEAQYSITSVKRNRGSSADRVALHPRTSFVACTLAQKDGRDKISDVSTRQNCKRLRQRQARYEAYHRERPPLSPGALRARRSRARRRAGLTVFHVEADQRRLIAALRAAGRMTDDANREDIERALAEILIDFAARWLGKKDSVRVTFAGVGAAISSAP